MSDEIRSCREIDETLAAYVDGEQAAADRQAADAHLAACPSCRTHADRERAARDLIHRRRDQLRTAAPVGLESRCRAAATDSAQPARRRSVRAWVPLSLAATLLLAIGGVFVFGLNDRVEALATGLVLDHGKCFRIAPSGRDVDASVAEQRWQQAQGWAITVPQSSDGEQLTLVDVRRCLTTDGWSAHLMYRWRGQPLSVYVVPRVVGSADVSERLGLETAIWSTGGRTYAVLADGRPPDFDRIVAYMKVHAK